MIKKVNKHYRLSVKTMYFDISQQIFFFFLFNITAICSHIRSPTTQPTLTTKAITP